MNEPPSVWPGRADARRSDPVTSHEARDSITDDRVAASQKAVLDAIKSVLWPMSDQEIAAVVNREAVIFSEARLRTARHELEEAGLVVVAGKVKPNGARTASRTWRLT